MFAYCNNNPVNGSDPTGTLTGEATIVATNWWNPAGWIAAAVLVVKVANKVRYVGRTNDPERREYEHQHDSRHPERKDYKMKVIATGLNVPQAKITEQALISAYTLDYLDNARREIAVGNLSGYSDNISAVIQIFESVTEDELRNLMGR